MKDRSDDPLRHLRTLLPRSYISLLREREREMFYLTTHSTHFIYGYMTSDIWLRTILIVRKETRCRHIGYSYRLTARVLYMHNPTDRIAHTTAFVTPVVEHWPQREIAQWVHHEGSIRRPIAPCANALTTELHLAPSCLGKDAALLQL